MSEQAAEDDQVALRELRIRNIRFLRIMKWQHQRLMRAKITCYQWHQQKGH